jgi:hypothetical protein
MSIDSIGQFSFGAEVGRDARRGVRSVDRAVPAKPEKSFRFGGVTLVCLIAAGPPIRKGLVGGARGQPFPRA